jgi:hypothetical protein
LQHRAPIRQFPMLHRPLLRCCNVFNQPVCPSVCRRELWWPAGRCESAGSGAPRSTGRPGELAEGRCGARPVCLSFYFPCTRLPICPSFLVPFGLGVQGAACPQSVCLSVCPRPACRRPGGCLSSACLSASGRLPVLSLSVCLSVLGLSFGVRAASCPQPVCLSVLGLSVGVRAAACPQPVCLSSACLSASGRLPVLSACLSREVACLK